MTPPRIPPALRSRSLAGAREMQRASAKVAAQSVSAVQELTQRAVPAARADPDYSAYAAGALKAIAAVITPKPPCNTGKK